MPFIKKPKRANDDGYVSSGSVLLNLGATGNTKHGFKKGTYVLFVGDSETGKTWFCITCLAEAAANPEFDKYRLILDDVEYGSLMDIERYFGKKLHKRLQTPTPEGRCSESLDEAYDNIENALDEGPCIYVLDSMDVLEARDDQKKSAEDKKARKAGKEPGGSYGMAKAKLNSTRLRSIVNKLRKTGSILIIISQTRDNIGFGFEKKTRSGGKALKFYAHLEIWSSLLKKLKKPVGNKDRECGAVIELQIKKNRYSGWRGKIPVPFLRGLGIDDIGSCVDYLIDEGVWKKTKGNIDAKELGLKLKREKLIQVIEDKGLMPQVRKAVRAMWDQIEKQTLAARRPKYE